MELAGAAVVFPGQGVQRPGLGREWRGHPAWALVERAEDACGRPLAPLLLDPEADLSRTADAQMAVLLASLLAWEAARATLPEPVAFAGHSLGQVTALVASGALGFEDGVRLAAARADATQAAADARPGAMAALLGASLDDAARAAREAPGRCWVANDNAPGQVVVGGTPDGVEAAAAAARRAVPLAVGGAFHTPLMEDAVAPVQTAAAALAWRAPSAPVVCNTDARPHDDREWVPRLGRHLVQPVRWRESVEAMAALGATAVVEVGPGTTLTALVKRIAPGLVAA